MRGLLSRQPRQGLNNLAKSFNLNPRSLCAVTYIAPIHFPQAVQAHPAQAEVAHLQAELQMRDQLVQQLSQELFRMVKSQGETPALMPHQNPAELQALRDQLQGVEQQVGFYQTQLAEKDATIDQLQVSVAELTERADRLEQVVQELPNLYRQKFAERMSPVQAKVAQIQLENRKLHAELQSVSYRLAIKSRRSGQLDLPNFVPDFATDEDMSVPNLGNA
jgi:DNA repair exonuclease SbcCD ATPase subunit